MLVTTVVCPREFVLVNKTGEEVLIRPRELVVVNTTGRELLALGKEEPGTTVV